MKNPIPEDEQEQVGTNEEIVWDYATDDVPFHVPNSSRYFEW